MSATDELLENARRYATRFDGAELPNAPSRGVAVLACMDARLDPRALLGIAVGEAHVINNAGGIASDDAIRSLSISQHMLGTREIVVIQHTECGLLGFTDEQFADRLEAEAGSRPGWRAGAFADLERSVLDTVARIEASPFIPHTGSVRGFVFDVRSGGLSEIG